MSKLGSASIEKTPGVCGGAACVRATRIAVWMLVVDRKLGMADAGVLEAHGSLTAADLDAAWDYYRENPVEIEQAIWLNDTAANVPQGSIPPVWVIVSGRILGLSDEAIRESFDPPLSEADLDSAWSEYRKDPHRVSHDVTSHRLAG